MFVLLSHFEQSVSILRIIIIIEKEPKEYSRDRTTMLLLLPTRNQFQGYEMMPQCIISDFVFLC